MDLPSDVVTFVFSDIEGSTRLWESDADGMRRSLARHDEIGRRVIEDAGGHVFKHTGDGFGAAFASVSSGVQAAVDVARALDGEQWTGPRLSCRFGVHVGEARPREGDYFGPTVTRTVRLMDAGNGGQIIVSADARRLVGESGPSDMEFVDEGEHRLKDLGQPIGLYRLVGEGAADDRALRTLDAAPHNLPVQLSSFIGREYQIKEVSDLVRVSRLVTLTGVGGVGKTRLALQAGAEVLSDFPDGVFLLELASLAEPGLLADSAAAALNVPPRESIPVLERVVTYLAQRRALLLMDNCEHLIEDVALFANTLLAACPDVHILATSREGLALTGEVLWQVPSLRIDDDGAAVELFAERARLVSADIVINDSNREVIEAICERLDGIPLAIELATARLKMLTVEQIAQHLDDRFRLLTGGSRAAVERHRTLRAMMDWSYDLLSEQEQARLRRLAVFYGGFTLEAAQVVCSGETLPRFEVLDLLGHLVEASVVTFESGSRPRYRLLETVRQYSLDRLVEAGEADDARLRHATHFRDSSEDIAIGIQLLDTELLASEAAQDDLDNFRAAMSWSLEAGEGRLALEMATNLRHFFSDRVMWRESVRWLSSGLEAVDDDDVSLLVARAASFALIDANNTGDNAMSQRLATRVSRLIESRPDEHAHGYLLMALASTAMHDDIRRYDELNREASILLRPTGDPRWGQAVVNRVFAALFMNSTHAEAEIIELVDQAVAEGSGLALPADLVRIVFKSIAGEYESVIEAVESVDSVSNFDKGLKAGVHLDALRATGRLEEAMSVLRRAKADLGSFFYMIMGWEAGMLYLLRNDTESATDAFSGMFQGILEGTPFRRVIEARCWSLIAERQSQHESAARLAGFTDHLAEIVASYPSAFDSTVIEQSRDVVRAALGTDRYDELFAQGAATPWEELPLVGSTGT